MGRKMLPTRVKKVKGTLENRRLNPNEPQPTISKPEAPDFLDHVALKEWNRVVDLLFDLGIMSDLDVAVLAAYCNSYSKVIHAQEQLNKMANESNPGGMLHRSATGSIVQNPLMGIVNVSSRDMCRYAAELGITPASRPKVNSMKPKGNTGWASFGKRKISSRQQRKPLRP